MPEKACQNPLTSLFWPEKGSCPPGDSSLLPHFGKGRGSVFLKRKNRNARKWAGEKITPREAMCRARGQRGLSWTPVESERGGDGRRSRGNVSCLIGECMVAGRQGSCLGRGTGRRGAREIAGREGRWYRPGESLWGRGAGRQGAAGQERLREETGSGIVPENHFEEGARGGRARWGKGGPRRGERWHRPGESLRGRGREVAGRGGKLQDGKNAGQKEKGGRGPPYLWYLEFCKIWKPR